MSTEDSYLLDRKADRHEESGVCGLRVRNGPLHDVFDALLGRTLQLAMEEDMSMDSDDYWMYGGAESDEEYMDYMMGNGISVCYLA
ncbi:hypothetical protein FVEN_g9156 [Fusarium venenatum]|nr:hypothetical protein FVEN_g9156 [Fusarium venenatum]